MIFFFLLQILLAICFTESISAIYRGKIVVTYADDILPPYRADVLNGGRARLVGLGGVILFAVVFAICSNFNNLIAHNISYTNIASALIGFMIYILLYNFRKRRHYNY